MLEICAKVLISVTVHIFFIICNDFFFCRKRAYFVDLFVRISNKVAINMYRNLGYIVYRTVLEYYAGDPDEDAYGKLKFNIGQKYRERNLLYNNFE